MDAFKTLIAAGKWNLDLPFQVRTLRVDDASLTWQLPSTSSIPEARILKLKEPTMQGDDVRQVQEKLENLGYQIEVDGYYGPLTEDAVSQFQTLKGLEIDGDVGPQTRAALGL